MDSTDQSPKLDTPSLQITASPAQEKSQQRNPTLNIYELRLSLHQRVLGHIPTEDIFSDLDYQFQNWSDRESNELRKAAVEHLFLSIAAETNYQLEASNQISNQDHNNTDPISPDTINAQLLTYSDETIIGARLQRIAEQRQWDTQKMAKYVTKILTKLTNPGIIPLHDNSSPESIEIALDNALLFIGQFNNSRQAMANYMLVETAFKTNELEREKPPEKPISKKFSLDNLLHKQRAKDLESMEDDQRMELALTTVNSTTDNIRTKVIPDNLNKGSQYMFWLINKLHFGKTPELSILFSANKTSSPSNIRSGEVYKDITQHGGKTRTLQVYSGSSIGRFQHARTNHLKHLESSFYNTIDSSPPPDDFTERVTLMDMFHIVTHLPQDAAGRTIEDFFAWYGQKHGHPLTISNSGFRELTSPLMADRNHSSKNFKKDIIVNSLQHLGINPHEQDWSEKPGHQEALRLIEEKFKVINAQDILYSEIAYQTTRIINALSDQSKLEALQSDYPSYFQLYHLWKKAENETYVPTPNKIRGKLSHIASQITLQGSPNSLQEAITQLSKFDPQEPVVAKLIQAAQTKLRRYSAIRIPT